MSKKYRNPKTGEIFILEEDDEESTSKAAKKAPPSDTPEDSDADGAEEPEGDAAKWPFGEFKTPFDFLDKIDGRDVEKVVLGAALGIGGVLAVKGLCSFFGRD
jgi:hypothetical protein